MDVGISIFPTDYSIRPDDVAVEVEGRGFDSLWFPEHTHIPASRATPFPAGGELPKHYWHSHDPFVALMAAAAATSRIKLATGICLLIERDTITVAKEVASLDFLSRGRVIFGVGGGWNREEMENHGTDYDTRFSRMVDQVRALKTIWTEDEAEYHGEFVDFDPIWSFPKPVQKPHPPIFFGGGTGHTRQRVVDVADGWLPIGFSADAVIAGRQDLQRRAAQAGRDPATLNVTVFNARPDDLERYREAGIDRVTLGLPSKERDEVLPLLDRYAEALSRT